MKKTHRSLKLAEGYLGRWVREAVSCKGFTCMLPASFHLACWLPMSFLYFDAQHLPAKPLLALCLLGAQQNGGFLPTGSPILERTTSPACGKSQSLKACNITRKAEDKVKN